MYKLSSVLSVLALIIVVVSGCSGGGGGGTPTASDASLSGLASLSGEIRHNNKPLPGAAVYLYKSDTAHIAGISQYASMRFSISRSVSTIRGSYSTMSSSDGRYSFKNIPVGEYTLIAVKDNNHQFVRRNVSIGSVTEVNAELTPTGSVRSKVVDSAGAGVAGAMVYLGGTSYVALTDSDGEFVISHVPENDEAYSLYAVSSGAFAEPVDVVIEGGTTKTIDKIEIKYVTKGQYIISGMIVPDDDIIEYTNYDKENRYLLLVRHETNEVLQMTRTNADGEFQFAVNPGVYDVLFIDGDYISADDELQTVTVSNSDVENVDFELSFQDEDVTPEVSIDPDVVFKNYNFKSNKWLEAKFEWSTNGRLTDIRLNESNNEIFRHTFSEGGKIYTYKGGLAANTVYEFIVESEFKYTNVSESLEFTTPPIDAARTIFETGSYQFPTEHFGFLAHGNNYYWISDNSVQGWVNSGADYSLESASLSGYEVADFTIDDSGIIYIAYFEGATIPLRIYDSNLTFTDQALTPPTGISGDINSLQLEFANGYLFLIVFGDDSNDSFEIFSYKLSDPDSGPQEIIAESSNVESAAMIADDKNLYVCFSAFIDNEPNTVKVKKYEILTTGPSGDHLGEGVLLTEFNSDASSLFDISVDDENIYLSSRHHNSYKINKTSGSVSSLYMPLSSAQYYNFVSVDKNNLWVVENRASEWQNSRLVRLDDSMKEVDEIPYVIAATKQDEHVNVLRIKDPDAADPQVEILKFKADFHSYGLPHGMITGD